MLTSNTAFAVPFSSPRDHGLLCGVDNVKSYRDPSSNTGAIVVSDVFNWKGLATFLCYELMAKVVLDGDHRPSLHGTVCIAMMHRIRKYGTDDEKCIL